MSYENTKCPCGEKKQAGTMICSTCRAFFASTIEHAVYQDNARPMQVRRAAAIKVLAMARRRKSIKWPPA